MPKIIMLVGLPGSGKSTWREKNADGATVVSTDDLIELEANRLGVTYSEAFTIVDFKKIEATMWQQFANAVRKGDDIIVDRTNLTIQGRSRYLARVPGAYEKHAIIFDVKPRTLASRLKKRGEESGKIIPSKVLDNMRSQYQPPSKDEGFDVITPA